MTSTQLSVEPIGNPPEAITEAQLAEIMYWASLEPEPVFRCQACGWELRTSDPGDCTSSEWYRMEEHIRVTRHSVSILWDADDPVPVGVFEVFP